MELQKINLLIGLDLKI